MPAVSPKKTIEGSIGGVAGNLVGGAIVRVVLLPSVPWREIIVLSIVAGLLAQLGDLCESLLETRFRGEGLRLAVAGARGRSGSSG